MNDIDPKALEHACQCAGRAVHHFDRMALDLPLRASIIAHARAIEQHEAFRQEVSDVVKSLCNTVLMSHGHHQLREMLSRRFIIAKPDPLVEILRAACTGMEGTYSYEELADAVSAISKARGYEFTKIGEKA